jgi:hypothetical protein
VFHWIQQGPALYGLVVWYQQTLSLIHSEATAASREAPRNLKPQFDFSLLWRIPLEIDIGNDQLTLTRPTEWIVFFVLPFLQPRAHQMPGLKF